MSSESRANRKLAAVAAFAALLATTSAVADLVFTSEPRTSATVGQPYFYTMTATYASDDDDDDDDDERKADSPPRFIARALPPWLEFDGNDTIFGTPGPEDVGQHRVRLRARSRGDSVDQDFSITVAAAPTGPPPQGADLSAFVSVSPNPVSVGATATWNVTARNLSDADVANAVLETVFSGDPTLQIDDLDDESCSIEQRGDGTAVTCRWSLLSGGASRSAEVTGRASDAGEILAVANASIVDTSPIDRNPDNNEARVVLSVIEAQSGASQELVAPGASAVAVEDFDGDGRDDVAVGTSAGEPVWVFLSDPDASGARPLNVVPISAGDDASAATGIAAGDLDGDGDADIVVASANGHNRVLVNNGFAGFETRTLEAAAETSHDVEIADVDGDSLPDLVFANELVSTVYRNLGNGEFSAEDVAAGPGTAVAAADLIGDGRLELIFAYRDRNAEVYGRSDGSYQQLATVETGPASSAAAADFDMDGDADLAFGRGAADLVLRNTSDGSLAFTEADRIGESASIAVLPGDFDMDGRVDIVSIGASGAHRLYSNANGAQFLAQTGFSGKPADDAALGQFDAGGAPDVVVAGSNVVAIFLNVGAPDSGGPSLGAPTLTLNGEPTVIVTIGETYQDPGATALDDADGDLTNQIVVDNPVDTNVIGRYSVTYEVEDSAGNFTTATRVVEVQARSPSGGGGGGAIGPVLLLALCGVLAATGRARSLP